MDRVAAMVVVVLILALMVGLLAPSTVRAQDTGIQPLSANAGPYKIDVWEYPSNLTVGKTLIVVNVVNAETGQGVYDARVLIRTKHKETGSEGRGIAVITTDVRERYEALMNLSPGT